MACADFEWCYYMNIESPDFRGDEMILGQTVYSWEPYIYMFLGMYLRAPTWIFS